MNCRFSVIAVLTAGVLLTAPAGALGASSISSRQDAVAAQYGGVVAPQSATLGTQAGSPGGAPQATNPAGSPGGAPQATSPAASGTRGTATQGTDAVAGRRQAATTTAPGLPFTGYAAIPLLLLGLALLVGGVLLRRSTRRRFTA